MLKEYLKAKKSYLQSHPICVGCAEHDKVIKATYVAEKIPSCGDKELFWDRTNWISLCEKCYEKNLMQSYPKEKQK